MCPNSLLKKWLENLLRGFSDCLFCLFSRIGLQTLTARNHVYVVHRCDLGCTCTQADSGQCCYPNLVFSGVGALGQLFFVCLFSVHVFRSQIQGHGIISKKPDTNTRLRIHAADHSFHLHTILKHQFTVLCCVPIILIMYLFAYKMLM